MKPLPFLCLSFCCLPAVKSQSYNQPAALDYHAVYIPATETQTSATIAAYIQAHFKTDEEKLAAIYSWVATNIRYDTDSMLPINWSLEQQEKVAATLRRRKGVCENYAALFTDIANKAGFPSFVVSGFANLGGSLHNSGHSWSAVLFQQQWYLCDPTWDNGTRGGLNYFMVRPAEFIASHMPFDPLWQLLEYPITEQEFRRGANHQKKGAPVNVNEQVKAFLQLDSLQQLEAAATRIKQAGIENDRLNNWVKYNQMKIAMIYGEQDMDLYNSAVADLNKASSVFNNFVKYRNAAFNPARSDAEIKALLDPVGVLLLSARQKIDKMGRTVENFQYDPDPIKDRINILSDRVREQKKFLERYLAVSVTERSKLFYK